jgi:hypothetical protein
MPVLASVAACGEEKLEAEVLGDTRCRACGYNLRGLRRDGRCPECSTAVAASDRADLLCFAEPGYVRRLARGLWWVIAGVWSLVTAIFIVFLLSIVGTPWVPLNTWVQVLERGVVLLLALVALCGGLASASGLWLFATPDPAGFGAVREPRRARLLLGLCVAGLLVGRVLTPPSPPGMFMGMRDVVLLAAAVCAVLGARPYLRHMSRVALRLPDRELARQTERLGRQVLLVLAGWLVIGGVDALIQLTPALRAPPTPGTPVAGAALVGRAWARLRPVFGIVVFLGFLVVLYRVEGLHRRLLVPLARQSRFAKRFWGGAVSRKP